MQPTLPQAAGTADMDLTAVQSINDWFFKKEQIYLLAQFWQQVSHKEYTNSSPIQRKKVKWGEAKNIWISHAVRSGHMPENLGIFPCLAWHLMGMGGRVWSLGEF